ncbi:MAG: transketolase [Anaeroplasma bactoclasticum]|nr:transketolase [Anaeroplasma bactoclasticum]MCM1556151.1 transketolase [Anaeroplasma bactoclasticum]
MNNYIDEECITTLRVIGAEMITKAKSGHPGIVLGAAPILHTLFTRHLNIDSNDEKWFDRDRFVLSAGHGSALLYLLLHFSGFDIPMKELASFRQKDSLTPGHPEYGHTVGVEMTTGPLGQGIATSVGLAIAEAHLAAKFNKQHCDIINHNTYVLCGDGDLQEGIAMEAMSLAGHLHLNKLIVLYDSNDIQLDGSVSLAASDSIENKVKAMKWNYLRVEDGNDVEEIDEAIKQARLSTDCPTLIEIKTEIGYGAPTSGESSVHGKPLTEDELTILKDNLNSRQMAFTASKEVSDYFHSSIVVRGSQANSNWNYLMSEYARKYKEDYELLNQYMFNDLKIDNYDGLPEFPIGSSVSTRVVMGKVLDWLSSKLPNLMGGSADLTPSTMVKGAEGIFSKVNPTGRNIKFGVREHAMAAITNGITLHGSLRGFCAGFFVFSDYMKPAIRLAAIMHLPSLFFFSHDSVCVGEDGPTHQPVEQLTMFRSMPNTNVFRPADAKEMASALLLSIETKENPTIIVSSRQNLEVLDCTDFEGVSKGAYIAFEPKGTPGALFVSCGSELALCIKVAKRLENEDIFVRVVSMPSMDLFERQSDEYKNKVLPRRITKRMAVEMGSSMCWYKYASKVHGIDEFGKSMPLKYIPEAYGFTEEVIYNEFLDAVKN